jgi:hypothetical protein
MNIWGVLLNGVGIFKFLYFTFKIFKINGVSEFFSIYNEANNITIIGSTIPEWFNVIAREGIVEVASVDEIGAVRYGEVELFSEVC